MIGQRSLRLAIGMAVLLACATLSCHADEIVWGFFDMPRAQSGCYLDGNASDLKIQLRSFGWRARGNNFPKIAWNKHMTAIVVPIQGAALEPTSIGISGGQVVVHLSSSKQSHEGIVLQVPGSYATLRTCRLQSDESADRVYPMFVIAGSVDSAVSDDEPVDAVPSQPAPLANESHTLPPTSTLPGTQAPE